MTEYNRIILASESPRRRELLGLLGLDFEIVPSRIQEEVGEEGSPQEIVQRLALEKARDVAQRETDAIVIGADTMVVLENHILGKPVDEEDARRMLHLLSGRCHQVMTGLAVLCGQKTLVGVEVTNVQFNPLQESEIDYYIQTGEPMDKAGAYAIQGRGSVMIDSIHGCYFNVVGLPISHLTGMLRQCGVPILGTL
jgi:septum formation protein